MNIDEEEWEEEQAIEGIYTSEMAEDTELYYDKENKKMRVVK